MKSLPLIVLTILIFANSVYAEPPDTLEGLKKIKQWTDYENKSGEMPPFIWANVQGTDRVGLYVEFADGTTGSITYRGIEAEWWNRPNGFRPGLLATTRTGFFLVGRNKRLRHLRNIPKQCGHPYCLPMAWRGLKIFFSDEFDLDYKNINGSHFRASWPGWKSVVFATYGNVRKYVLK